MSRRGFDFGDECRHDVLPPLCHPGPEPGPTARSGLNRKVDQQSHRGWGGDNELIHLIPSPETARILPSIPPHRRPAGEQWRRAPGAAVVASAGPRYWPAASSVCSPRSPSTVPKTGTPRRSASQFLFTQRRLPSRGPPIRGRTCGPHTITASQAALWRAPNYAQKRSPGHKAFFISRLTTAVRSATNTPEWLILSALDRFRGLLVGTLFLSLHVRIGVRRAPRQGVRPDFR